MMMEEFLCNLITASSGDGLSSGAGDCGGGGGEDRPDLQTPAPQVMSAVAVPPVAASAPLPVMMASTSTSMMASSSSSSLLGKSSTSSQMQPAAAAPGPSSAPLGNRNLDSRSSLPVPVPVAGPSSAAGMTRPSGNENSILTTDVSHMVAWLNSQNHSQISGGSLGSVGSQYAGGLFEVETSRIPKPYNGMNPNDCASVVAKSIRSIIMYTCNDDFRQQCFEKLGGRLNIVSSSRDAEFEVRRRLNEMLLQQTQESASVSVSSPNESMDIEEQQSNLSAEFPVA